MFISKILSHKSYRTPVNRTPNLVPRIIFEGMSNIAVRTYDVLGIVWCEPKLVHVENFIQIIRSLHFNALQIATAPTNAQFHYYVIHS